MKKRGQTAQVYVTGNTMHLYQSLEKRADETGKSTSELLRRGIECVALEQACNVQLTPSAYFAMQDSCFNVLTSTRLADGTILISVTEDVYKTKYESKVQTFLSSNETEGE